MALVAGGGPGFVMSRNAETGEIETEPTDDGIWIERAIIPEVQDYQTRMALQTYARCRLFGGMDSVAWPYPGGWADQPCILVDVVETLLTEERRGSNP